jgi:hypothetical protein
VALEELYLAFVLFRLLPRLEGSEIAALAGLRISLSGVEPVFTGFQFPNHMLLLLFGLSATSASLRSRGYQVAAGESPVSVMAQFVQSITAKSPNNRNCHECA